MEQCLNAAFIQQGTKIYFFSGDVLKLLEDVAVAKPTLFVAVPRLLNKLYAKINSNVSEAGGAKEKLFRSAIESKITNLHANCSYHSAMYDAVVFKKIRAILGGQVRLMITGSAPIAKEVMDFLKVAFSCPIIEGYGQTEVCGAATCTSVHDPFAGKVGGPITAVKIRLRDVPEMSYTSKDIPHPRGEVQFFGPSNFKGYFRNPEKTAEAFDEDGWVCSGDVGELLEDGSIKIIDRAKNIFKLSQGEYIAPEKLENIYIQSKLVAQMFVYGHSLENWLVAVAVIDPETLEPWCASKDLNFDEVKANINGYPDLKADVFAQMAELHTANKLNSLEKVKKLHFTMEPFTVENEILTSTMKLKRHQARIVYQEQLDAMYAEGN